MFGLGGFEVAIILLFAFLIFGPDKLPQIARTIGRVISQFRTAQEQMTNVIKAEVYDPIKDLEPMINPFSGFSLDGLGDSTKKDEPKKAAPKKEAAKKSEGALKDKEGSKDSALTAGDAGVIAADGSKPSGEDMKAAVTADADKAKMRALRDAAYRVGGTQGVRETQGAQEAQGTQEAQGAQEAQEAQGTQQRTESFAVRRARLEQEHAKAKAARDTAAKTQVDQKPVANDGRKEGEEGA